QGSVLAHPPSAIRHPPSVSRLSCLTRVGRVEGQGVEPTADHAAEAGPDNLVAGGGLIGAALPDGRWGVGQGLRQGPGGGAVPGGTARGVGGGAAPPRGGTPRRAARGGCAAGSGPSASAPGPQPPQTLAPRVATSSGHPPTVPSARGPSGLASAGPPRR